MNEPSRREALLGQSGPAGPSSSPQLLDELLKAENQRMRRLTLAALAVWASWLFVVALPFGVYFLFCDQPENWFTDYIAVVSVGMFLIGAPLLPIIGTVLVILAVLARRSAKLCNCGAAWRQWSAVEAIGRGPRATLGVSAAAPAIAHVVQDVVTPRRPRPTRRKR